jgi:F-type H+-transporting ATPase subunit a
MSYVARAFSLGIRLFANITSGHALVHILGGFTFKIANSNIFFALKFVPILLLSIILSLEIGIAFLQAYVFVILTASYLKDVA